jgi:electron transfer flavoprotein beta subunit
MRIIVPIKQVPETNAVKMDEASGTMIRDGVEAIINPLDLYAIEIAIQLREAGPPGATEVVAISMGPPKAASALREAIAMGIDSAVLVSDKAFAGSDTWATSYVLAAAIRRICACSTGSPPVRVPLVLQESDLIICGERATDGDTGQVGPGIAAFLDLPVVSYVGKIESVAGGKARVHRLVEDGHEVLDVDLPAVLTVVKEIASPRLPTLDGKLKAKKTQVPLWGPKDLDVEADKLGLEGSPTRVVKIFRPKVARECRKMLALDELSVAKAVCELVEFLKNRELV